MFQRSRIINRESNAGAERGETWGFSYLSRVSHMYFSFSVGCLFIAKEWFEYNVKYVRHYMLKYYKYKNKFLQLFFFSFPAEIPM
jgi:hypothetical protein